ncbi:MAG: HupE/UreJ family protein [Chitinophagales bacterium]
MAFFYFLKLGVLHVIPLGFDHILFIVSLFFLRSDLRSSALQCSVFTVAHSLTLWLSATCALPFNSTIVESAIAFSIFIVALENVYQTKISSWRLIIVFVFGLIHGMGFAASLKEVNLPQASFLAALFGFNCGVEIAQLSIIALLYFGIASWASKYSWYQTFLVKNLSLLIAGIGLFWSIERIISN